MPNQFCLVHIDCDLYESAKTCLNFFAPRIVPGGFIIVDDYDFELCPGVEKAVDEFIVSNYRSYIYFNHASAIMRFS